MSNSKHTVTTCLISTVKMRVLFLVLCASDAIYPMQLARPVQRTQTHTHAIKLVKINYPVLAAVNYRRSYSQSPEIAELKEKIQECRVTKREFWRDYEIWDQIVTECIWQRTCKASGRCSQSSNCLSNGQLMYLAWQSTQKRLATYETQLAILTYGKES